jgi:hypothetical protein
MQHLFGTAFAVTCIIGSTVIGSTPGFARAGAPGMVRGAGVGMEHGAGAGMGGRARIGIGRGAAVRQMPARPNPIPAPLSEPAQAPIINGPLNSNGLPSMGSAGLP